MSGQKRMKNDNSPVRRMLRRYRRNKAAMVCLFLFLLIFVSCLAAPLVTGQDPEAMNMDLVKAMPSREHPMGTDFAGRDLFSRMLYGGRLTFSICFTAVGLSLFGLIFGIAAGYLGGAADMIISRVSDVLATIPTFLLAVFFELCLPSGQGNYKYAIALALMPPLIRLSRTLVMEIMDAEYIEAARALGVGKLRIAAGHVMRNISGPLIVQIFSNLSDAILTCTIMGYLGLGVHMPRVEWGTIVKEGLQSILSAPLQIVMPCLVVFICVLFINVVGSCLRDAVAREER